MPAVGPACAPPALLGLADELVRLVPTEAWHLAALQHGSVVEDHEVGAARAGARGDHPSGPKHDGAAAAQRDEAQRQLAAVQASGLPFHVVEHSHTAHLPQPGMGDSIAAGVTATADACGWLILPGDLPLIRPDTLHLVASRLMTLPAGQQTVQPRFEGLRGHPVGFRRACGEALRALRGDEGARGVLAQWPPAMLSVDDEGTVLDVDTPERLAQAEQRLR